MKTPAIILNFKTYKQATGKAALKLAKICEEERRRRMYAEAQKVYEKYQRGEKLSLDEFKLLMEFDLIKQQT